jgi:alkanesulfonate monooxygenase SsuD/methylene tetrahydromethanopterin reductase-like flavin-dependent oxidoreductase (luciferase family)
MKLGIGLPATIPNTPAELVLEWARQADEKGFSSLGIIDRLVYPNLEPMITLAAVSSITKRVRLMTTILLAPLRNTALLAKEAATLDRLSGGRFTLGLGIGAREDDFLAAGIHYKSRAKRFEEQMQLMRKIWAGEMLSNRVGKIGPATSRQGRPEVLIGGYTAAAAARAGRLGDGFIAGGGLDAKAAASFYLSAEEAWGKAGRKGKPRFVCSAYYALGSNAAEKGSVYVRDYYAFMGAAAENVAKGILSTPSAVENAVKSFAEAGADELMLWPTIPELEQVELVSKYLE